MATKMPRDDRTWSFVGIGLVIFLLLAGAAGVIAAINLGTTIVAFGVILAFQILIVLLAVATTVAVLAGVWLLLVNVWKRVVRELDDLRRSHRELLAMFRRRTVAAAATTTLIAAGVLSFADKSFEDDKRATVITSVILIIFFFLANELITAATRTKRVFGFVIWCLGIAIVPAAVMLQKGWSIPGLVAAMSTVELRTKVGFACALVVMAVTPIAVSWRDEAGQTSGPLEVR